jgi:hypothetical protein
MGNEALIKRLNDAAAYGLPTVGPMCAKLFREAAAALKATEATIKQWDERYQRLCNQADESFTAAMTNGVAKARAEADLAAARSENDRLRGCLRKIHLAHDSYVKHNPHAVSEAQLRLLTYFLHYAEGVNLGPIRGPEKFIAELRPAFAELLAAGLIRIADYEITDAGCDVLRALDQAGKPT